MHTPEQEKQQLQEVFMDFVRQEGTRPRTVFQVAERIAGLEERDFYTHYPDLSGIEQDIWAHFFEDTLTRLRSEEVYMEYSVREKLLAFYFTFMEVLREERSFIKGAYPIDISSKILKKLKELFKDYAAVLLQEGMRTGEIEERQFVSGRYADFMWTETKFLINFWRKDGSEDFEKTDAAIEKAVNLTFDFFGRNVADSVFDFARFAFSNRKKR